MQISRVVEAATSATTVFPELEPPVSSSIKKSKRHDARANLQVVPERSRSLSRLQPRANVLSFANMHRYGNLWRSFMKARKSVFVDRLRWSLPVEDGMEFDQYDTPYARWVVIHEYGEVLAGVRLTPTTAKVGLYSYMLRDAQLGLLDNIPRDVLFFEAPVEDRIFEATRLFITDDVPAERRLAVQSALMGNFARAARAEGATHVIGIVPAVWSRWLRRLEMGAVPVGPRFEIDGTRSQAALFNVVKPSI